MGHASVAVLIRPVALLGDRPPPQDGHELCAPVPPPPVGNLCDIPSGTAGALNYFGCQTAIGSNTLGNYAICDGPAFGGQAPSAQVKISKHG